MESILSLRHGVKGPSDSEFDVQFHEGRITSLRKRNDSFDTDYILAEKELGQIFIRFRTVNNEWKILSTENISSESNQSSPNCARHIHDELELTTNFEVDLDCIRWSISLRNRSNQSLEIGDLSVSFPMDGRFRDKRPSTECVLKHSLISGDGSFMFWMRPNSIGPYLMVTPVENTHLEYWDTNNRIFNAYIHSLPAGEEAANLGTDWRQPHTSYTLSPANESGDSQSYGFQFQWADDYDDVRNILVENGLIDIHVVPGMTVPLDLFADFALRTKQKIHKIDVEYVDQTQVQFLSEQNGYQLYRVKFFRLGENRLTIHYGDNQQLYLEFFCTESLETLIHKRAKFITEHQYRDPQLWYDGLLAEWAMDKQIWLSPDNYDRIKGWRIYEVTCDDPGLSKPAFLAEKLSVYPDPDELEALDYYLERFVWGGLQMTEEEAYPYGIYGIPDWNQNRRHEELNRNGRLHIWRIYDYPHIFLVYHRLYRVIRDHPKRFGSKTANDYLERAYRTAIAMFTIPFEIEGWSAYATGLYNELVIPEIINDLENTGEEIKAERLRSHWKRKVLTFVTGEPDLFESEYAFDSTGFESTHAIAQYAINDLIDDQGVTSEQAQNFLQNQIDSNIFCRGWIETAYYYLGSDYRSPAGNAFTLTYMSQMGGWALLDYALNYADQSSPYIRLGYASFLSAWALINSGTPESNYGYWYPGLNNDGAAGGGFEPAPHGKTWLGQPHTRGSWYYSCESDLGFAGAIRAARTIIADDDIFGRVCYGGHWMQKDGLLQVIPLDGVRKRFSAVLQNYQINFSLDRDRFASNTVIGITEPLDKIIFCIESDNSFAHSVKLDVTGLNAGNYKVVGPLGSKDFEVKNSRSVVIDLDLPENGSVSDFWVGLRGCDSLHKPASELPNFI